MTDKAVSTEDLMVEVPIRNPSLDAVRLEAVIKTLIENKVEALKQEKRKSSSITSSPKSLINRLRITSTSSVASSKDKDDPSIAPSRIPKWHQRRNAICEMLATEEFGRITFTRKTGKPKRLGHATRKAHSSNRSIHNVEDGNDYLHRNMCEDPGCAASMIDCQDNCYCRHDTNGEIRMHFDDDYISLKIEDCEDVDLAEANHRALRRAQRKRRRRRKRRLKQHQMALNPITVSPGIEEYKEIDPDELSKRARLAIVITACLLLFMCLFLVGITLRMAPIIDDMVGKDHEEFMNSLSGEFLNHKHHNGLVNNNSTASVPSTTK